MLSQSVALLALAAPGDPCAELGELVRTTYDFQPARLSDEERRAVFAEMDAVWSRVKAAPDELIPCLEALLAAEGADPWFRCDGSALLAAVQPTRAALELQAHYWCEVPLSIVDLEPWTWTLAKLGTQGLDVSRGGLSWLVAGDMRFTVAQHALVVGREAGSLIVFGSMDEAQATPVLARIAGDRSHPGRAEALSVLGLQATEEALAALRALDLTGFSEEQAKGVRRLTGTDRPKFPRGRSGGAKRAELVAAMEAFAAGEPDAWQTLERDDEEWLAHLAGTLAPEDGPLLRRVRRLRLLALSDEALYDYLGYSEILWSMVWKRPG